MRIDIDPAALRDLDASEEDVSKSEHVPISGSNVVQKGERRDSETKYWRLLNSIYDAVLITELSGDIIEFNDRALDLFGVDEETLNRRNIMSLISGADESLLESIHINLEDRIYTLVEAHCIRQDTKTFPAEIAANRIEMNDGEQLCFLIRDVTVRKRTQEELEKAIDRLERLDRARTDFVYSVSHELRTPLTSMTYAITNMLRGVAGPVSDRAKDYLKLLDGDCKRLLGTVNDILDLRKIDTKTLKLARARLPFPRLVRRTLESIGARVDAKGLKLNLCTGKSTCFVDCDQHKMERVVLNLVDNALKFAPAEGEVSVFIEPDPGVENRVRLDVIDDGPGIPESSIDKVMDRYYTIGEQTSGTGLGLAISAEIVRAHGGEIKVISPPPGKEKGTLVRVSMPVIDAPTVLVVDDDRAILDLLEIQLFSQGYRILRAEDGKQGLDIIAEHKPDLVVLDMVMPDLEGTEVILKMKSDDQMRRIPIIVITGAHMGRAKFEILNNFGIPAVRKPWKEADLLDRIEGAFLGKAAFTM